MSKSYKRTPIVKQTTKCSKRIANRKYRRIYNNMLNIELVSSSKNNNFKKYYESYNIHDYSLYESCGENYKRYLDYVSITNTPISYKEWTIVYNKAYYYK